MANTIQLQSPGAAFGDSIATSNANQRQRQLDLQAAAKVKADADYRNARAARSDMESDRTFGIQQGEANDAHLRAKSDLETAAQDRAIAQEAEAFNKRMQPLLLQAAQVEVKVKQGEVVSAADRHKLDQANAALTQFELGLAHKYGAQKAKAEADEAAARVGLTRAQTLETQEQSGVQQSEIARNNAEIYRIMHPNAPKPTADERRTAQELALENAIGSLSPKGQEFYQMLNDHGPNANPPTRVQAMLALDAAKRGSGLTPADYQALQAIILSRDSSFVTSATQNSNENHAQNVERTTARQGVVDARTNAKNAATSSERNFTDTVSRTKAYKALPADVQQLIRSAMVTNGMTVQQVLDQVKTAPPGALSDAERQQIQAALSGG